jgi:L-lactate dehydrogenase complex protein LldG
MSEAKSQIFSGIRRALGRGELPAEARAAADARLAEHPRGTIPARSALGRDEKIALFVAMAETVAATVRRVAGPGDVPDAVAEYLAGQNLSTAVKAAPDPALEGIPWSKRPLLSVTAGRADDGDATSLTGALAAVAETGTLVLASGPHAPSTLNFMPETHIVVLRAAQIVGAYEEAWDLLRQSGAMPRTVNWITGPSRTGDIEQQIQLGAHGPRRLHIVLVEGEDG